MLGISRVAVNKTREVSRNKIMYDLVSCVKAFKIHLLDDRNSLEHGDPRLTWYDVRCKRITLRNVGASFKWTLFARIHTLA